MEEYKNLRDEEVLIKSLDNPKLFEILVDKYRDSFLRTAGRVLRSTEDAEDVCQDAFVKIYFYAKKFQKREGIEFKSWAFKILMNCAFTRYRKLKKTYNDKEYLDQLLYVPSEDMDTILERRENKDEILSVINRMPRELGDILKEHYFEDRPYVEIAAESGASIPALKMKLFRARKKFKEIWSEMN